MRDLTIGVLTCIWKRHALAGAMLAHTARAAPADCPLVAVGSEGDASSILVAAAECWDYVEAPNDPRPAKWNAGLREMRDFAPDIVVILGSDDFVSPGYFDAIRTLAASGFDYGGLLDCYVWRAADEEAVRWPGYPPESHRHGETIGSGRWFTRRVLDALHWKLWPEDGRSVGLDASSMARVRALGLQESPLTMGNGVALIDVKSDQNGADIGTFSEMAEGLPRLGSAEVFADFPHTLLETLRDVCDPVPAAPLFLTCEAPAVSAVMIARNGSAYLGACLASLVGVVDEVTVLVDAASTDRTEAICRAAGCRVFVEPWRGFGPQRTRSLELARGEWAFVIDCDEVLESPGNLRALALAASDDVDGFTVYMDTEAVRGRSVASRAARMLRRSRASYRYKRHNELVGIKNVDASTASIRTSYAGRLRGRAEAEIPDLLAEDLEFPDGQHAPYYLARAYRSLGNWTAAAEWANKCIKRDPYSIYGAGACAEAAHAIAAAGKSDIAMEVVSSSLKIHPGYADLHMIRATLALMDWARATLDPGRYASLAQLSKVENALRLPDAARMLGLPIAGPREQ